MISRSVVCVLVLVATAPCVQAQTQTTPVNSVMPDAAPPAPSDAAAPVAPTVPSEPFTRETPIEKIAADPGGAAVLNKDIPGLLTDKSYDFFKSMNLKQIQRLSDGDLSDDMVRQAEADLKALPGR
jgi:glucose/arabinose dehydrogenase